MKLEIKFRACLNSKYYENQRMLSWEELLSQYDAIDMFQKDLMTLMQYTGLHDKNGREIYESDILRVERNDDPNDFYIAPVSWCGGDYPAFDILPKYWPHWVNYDTNALSAIYAGWSEEVMTVIGNIHEDPDLLEATK